MKPRIPITSPAFRYYDAAHTNVARTFARERRRLAQQKAQTERVVVPIEKRKEA